MNIWMHVVFRHFSLRKMLPYRPLMMHIDICVLLNSKLAHYERDYRQIVLEMLKLRYTIFISNYHFQSATFSKPHCMWMAVCEWLSDRGYRALDHRCPWYIGLTDPNIDAFVDFADKIISDPRSQVQSNWTNYILYSIFSPHFITILTSSTRPTADLPR